MRVLLTRGSMNRSQRDGGLPPDSVVQDEDTILADSERVVAKHHQRGEDAMVQIALAPCSPFSVTTSLMRATADLADKLDVRLHTHLAETEDENKFCEQTHGCRPLDYLEQCGWLNARTWLAHGIFFNAAEMKRLGKAGTTISHCACSNQILASGCCPVCDMEAAGVGNRARRRRLGLERRIQSDAGSARRVPAAARALWRRPRQPQGCAALGHQGIGGLRRPSRTRRDRGRQSRRSCAVQARRIALLRPWRSVGGAGAVRRASRRPRHGGAANGW